MWDKIELHTKTKEGKLFFVCFFFFNGENRIKVCSSVDSNTMFPVLLLY